MSRLVDKFGLYVRHLKEFIGAEKNTKTKATVKGKLDKILDAQVLLQSALLKDSLAPQLSMKLRVKVIATTRIGNHCIKANV